MSVCLTKCFKTKQDEKIIEIKQKTYSTYDGDVIVVDLDNSNDFVISDELIIYNLKIVASLKKNQKLWLSDNKLSIDKSLFSPYLRKLHHQSRDKIMEFLKKFYNYVIKNKSPDIEILILVGESNKGLMNLCKIYSDKIDEITSIMDLWK